MSRNFVGQREHRRTEEDTDVGKQRSCSDPTSLVIAWILSFLPCSLALVHLQRPRQSTSVSLITRADALREITYRMQLSLLVHHYLRYWRVLWNYSQKSS